MSQLVRSGFRVPPIHKPPPVEAILAQVVELCRTQAIQVECLKRCVGAEKFEAELAKMVEEGQATQEPAP